MMKMCSGPWGSSSKGCPAVWNRSTRKCPRVMYRPTKSEPWPRLSPRSGNSFRTKQALKKWRNQLALNVIKGAQNAENVLVRIDPLDLDSLPESVLARTQEAFGEGVTPLQSVHQMLDDVRQEGDAAVRRYAKLLDGSDLEDFRVTEEQMAEARNSVSKELRESLELAAQRVRDFHEATMPSDWVDREKGLGELVRPLDRVGLYAPGGSAAYPSTVLMTAVPARVAGVREVILCTPP
ncbi:MAG: hypothetical protein FI723_00910, partial [SAR202 cluster bacterium]|nr:hypothetical protein [SAR202 cluster bacterium]